MHIQQEPHFEISSTDLAAWVEQQGADRWWTVDGDPLLTGLIPFPAPGDDLAGVLRRVNRVLLVADRHQRPESRGRRIGAADLDGLAFREGETFQGTGEKPPWFDNRLFELSWKGGGEDWLLIEDLETTESERRDLLADSGKE
jgi:hypothetical protein